MKALWCWLAHWGCYVERPGVWPWQSRYACLKCHRKWTEQEPT